LPNLYYCFLIFVILCLLIVTVYYFKLRKSYLILKQNNFELGKTLEIERINWNYRQNLQQEIQQQFHHIANEALLSNNQHFLNMAKSNFDQMQNLSQQDLLIKQEKLQQLVNPLQQALTNVQQKIQDLEKERLSAYGDLKHQLVDLLGSQKELRQETASLVKALRSPNTRGQWGEIQLKRVIELSGMIEHCDFVQQSVLHTNDNKILKPDVLVRLPANKYIIIDAKVPMIAYLESIEQRDELINQQLLKEHARQVKDHLKKLGKKSYHEQFIDTPEFVVMFLPSESIFSAALEVDPTLIEIGVHEKVLMATPTTLIALLRAVAYGWKQENVANNAKIICNLGIELSKRLHNTMEHMDKFGRQLNKTLDSYHQLSNSLEKNVFGTAKQLGDYGIKN
jgi:DNA recombination protein RmuC